LTNFYKGTHIARLVKWQELEQWIHGIVEAEKSNLLRIYVFNKDSYGKRRAVKRLEDVLFT